jgi:sugar-specific transcriptional regulator TrmB
MSTQDAVESLERLGLPNYAAQVFVALHRLGEGTAQDVSEASEVPRSQVYGAAEELAERGLVEQIESSPKRYRPVSLDSARSHLRERMEREEDRAFRNLEAIQHEAAGRDTVELATLRGRHPVDDRAAALIAEARQRVIYVCGTADLLPETVAAALLERAEAGVGAFVATADADLAARFEDTPVRAFLMDPEQAGEFTGRSMLVDDATVLLSSYSADDGGTDETALWTDGSEIGEILAGFIQSGMESSFDLE